jgi:hypothetical protein
MKALLKKYIAMWLAMTVSLLMVTVSSALAVYPSIDGDNSFEWITNVTFNTIDNTSVADTNGYGNYTAVTTTVVPGTTYQLSVTINPDTGEKISVFFDWNQNEVFTDPGEEVVVTPDIIQSPDPDAFTATIGVNVPVTATLGATRMRVVLSFLNNDTDPVQSSGTLPGGEAEDYTVNIDNGSGSPVISATAGANGTITPSGAVTVTSGSNQAFAIAAATGFFIDDVMVDGSSVGAVSSYTFTNVVANHTIHAVFSGTLNHTITATAGANGSITPAGAVRIADGTSQTFSIQPDSGNLVADVLVDGSSVGTVSSYTFTNVTADHTLAASFTADTAYPAVSSSDVGSEWITNVTFGAINNNSNAEGYGAFLDKSATVQQGGAYPVAITIHPQADENISVFIDWNQDGDFTDAGEETKVVELTPTAGPHASTINVPAGAVLGTTRMRVVVRYFEPAVSSGDLAAASSGGEAEDYTIVVASPVPAVDASVGANPAFGTVNPSGHILVASGANLDIIIDVNDPVYLIQDVLVDGVTLGGPFTAPYTYTFTNVVVTHTIQADFSNVPFQTITATAGPDGTITPFGALKVPVGDNKVFMITADTGFAIKDVLVDGGSVGPVASYTFTNVTADHSITAMFSLFHEITATAGPNGTISPAGVVKVAVGNNQVFTITPNAGYMVKDVQVDGGSVGPVPTYTFTNVNAPHQISASFVKIFSWPMFLPAIVNAKRGV